MKKLFIWTVLLILFSFGVSAVPTLFSDSFTYYDAYANHGWTFGAGSCGLYTSPEIPRTSSPFGLNAFGHNETNPCAFGDTKSIQRSFIPVTDFFFEYSVAIYNDTTDVNPPITIQFRRIDGTTPRIDFKHYKNSLNTTGGSQVGFSPCNIDLSEKGKPFPYNISGKISIDTVNKQYSWFVDGSDVGCTNKVLETGDLITSIGFENIFWQTDASEYLVAYLDDGVFNGTANETILGVASDELVDTIDDIWTDYGMATASSRYLFGVLLLVLFIVFLVGIQAVKMHSVSGIGTLVASAAFTIALVYMKLLPVWLFTLFIVLAAVGVGFLIFLFQRG